MVNHPAVLAMDTVRATDTARAMGTEDLGMEDTETALPAASLASPAAAEDRDPAANLASLETEDLSPFKFSNQNWNE